MAETVSTEPECAHCRRAHARYLGRLPLARVTARPALGLENASSPYASIQQSKIQPAPHPRTSVGALQLNVAANMFANPPLRRIKKGGRACKSTLRYWYTCLRSFDVGFGFRVFQTLSRPWID